MIKTLWAQKRINSLYRRPKDSIYTHRFFEDLCTGYSYVLGEKNGKEDFLDIEPNDCYLSKLIKGNHYYDWRYDLEQTISNVTYSLLAFDRAFVYLMPEYTLKDDSGNKVLSSIKIAEIKGFVKKRKKDDISFCCKDKKGIVNEIKMKSGQLIEFDIKELGYRKRYFSNIIRRLEKCDITKSSAVILGNNLDGYDFSVHSKRRKLQELKASREVGWSFGIDGLSDSYILYKKIQSNKLKILFLGHILKKVNIGLSKIIDADDGLIIAHIKERNYDQIWQDYSNGRITGPELTRILY